MICKMNKAICKEAPFQSHDLKGNSREIFISGVFELENPPADCVILKPRSGLQFC
jgi:hypothetical protein